MVDRHGQSLRIHIENVEGEGGQRNITVYCPYWIVNTTQYMMRVREEGTSKDQLPLRSRPILKKGRHASGKRVIADEEGDNLTYNIVDNGDSNEDEIVEDGLNKENESDKGGNALLQVVNWAKDSRRSPKASDLLCLVDAAVSLIVLVTMPHLESMMLKKDSGIA